MMYPTPSLFSRRTLLRRTASGFGLVGLAATLDAAGLLNAAEAATEPAARAHFPARAKRVIFLFMNGGPSHVDTLDPKPALKEKAGQKPEAKRERSTKVGGFQPSPFAFRAHGKNGLVLSELFPNLARCADDLCVIR